MLKNKVVSKFTAIYNHNKAYRKLGSKKRLRRMIKRVVNETRVRLYKRKMEEAQAILDQLYDLGTECDISKME